MRIARKMLRKRQMDEIRHSWCVKCGGKLIVRNGDVICKRCEAPHGKVKDRI